MIVWYGRRPGSTAPGDLEAGAAVLERDAGARCDEAGAEAHVVRLDEGDGHPVAVDRAEVDGAAGRLGDRRGLARAPAIEVLGGDQLRHVRAVAHALERVLERELHAADLRRERRRGALEQPEPLERRDALRRRRQLEHLVAAVGDAERLDPARLVRRRCPPPRATSPTRSTAPRHPGRTRMDRARRSREASCRDRADGRSRRRSGRAGTPPARARRAPTPRPSAA